MKYLVNRETKEHKLLTVNTVWSYKDWREVEADDEGWIAHSGTECPLPGNCRVAVLFSDGTTNANRKADFWGWRDSAPTHYRPILEAEPVTFAQEVSAFQRQVAEMRQGKTIPIFVNNPESAQEIAPPLPSLFEQLDAAHQAAAQIPDIIEQIKAKLEQYGHTVVPLSPFVEAEPAVETPQDNKYAAEW